MIKKKLKIEELKVKSFITNISNSKAIKSGIISTTIGVHNDDSGFSHPCQSGIETLDEANGCVDTNYPTQICPTTN